MTLPSATDVEYVGTGTSGGTSLGHSATEKISFFGTTPIAQRSGAAQAAVATTAASTAAAAAGYTTKTQANAIVTLVNELRAAMVAYGLITGAS